MMGSRLPTRSGDECDVITRWRRLVKLYSRAGVTSQIKRSMRRRERRVSRDVDAELSEYAAPQWHWQECDCEDWDDDWCAGPARGDLTGPSLHVQMREVIR